jgi:hypothetical protein
MANRNIKMETFKLEKMDFADRIRTAEFKDLCKKV